MLECYESQLNQITVKIDSYFAQQKDYIKCKQGCSICCSNSYYPSSELEYKYLKKGIELYYSKEDVELLHKKVFEIYKNVLEFKKNNSNIFEFSYVCPFLKDNKCSVYKYRPLVCRAHGLIIKDSSAKIAKEAKGSIPYCVNENLNYSNIWDDEKKLLSREKVEALGLKVTPKVYDLSCSSLMNLFEGVTFGDTRIIYEWVIMDMPDYEELMKLYQ